MACYHPLLGIRYETDYETGEVRVSENAKSLRIIGSYSPERANAFSDAGYMTYILPCGNCIGCRLDRSRHWADRMLVEYDHTKKACFVTLTYDEDHLSYSEEGNPTLVVRDTQLFLKRLRKYISGIDKKIKIRFYLSGEYGSKRLRPHYHLIIFGITKEFFGDILPVGKNELGNIYFKSRILDKLWNNGLTCVCDVSWKTFAYVARYVQKKLFGKLSNVYTELGIKPEFSTMSRNPGIGGYFFDDHGYDRDNFKTKFWFSENGDDPISVELPRYLLEKISLKEPDLYAKIISDRREFASDKMLLQLQQTDLCFEHNMFNEEEKKIKTASLLPRNYEENKISLNL